jgi:hypothetical protein
LLTNSENLKSTNFFLKSEIFSDKFFGSASWQISADFYSEFLIRTQLEKPENVARILRFFWVFYW